MTVRSRILLIVSVILLLGAGLALAYRYVGAEDRSVLTYDEVLGKQAVSATYHSINNWATVEDTGFTGVPLFRLLEDQGVTDDGAQIKVIAPDGYFWPAVDTVLTLGDLKTPNQNGLYPMLAWEMNGETLQPEPDGTGPLRLVMPQYGEEEVNKPSWVSNVRLIEVGPLPEGYAVPDAGGVPVDELRLYGGVRDYYPVPLWVGILLAAIGLLLLLEALYHHLMKRHEEEGPAGNGAGKAALLLLAVCLAAAGLSLPPRTACAAAPGDHSAVFGMSELRSMPVSGGHYTFLKSQEPFTYYEADYEGVSLSYLLQGAMQLAPGAQEVVVRCTDGYKVTLSLSQATQAYPGGLQAIIAYSKGGSALKGDEGPLRLIVPQASPGNVESGGDANTPYCARMVYAVEVTPVPAGVAVPAPGSVPSGSLAVYGALTVPEPEAEPQAGAAETAIAPDGSTPAAEETPEAAVEAAAAGSGNIFAATIGSAASLRGFITRVVAAGAFPALLDLMMGQAAGGAAP